MYVILWNNILNVRMWIKIHIKGKCSQEYYVSTLKWNNIHSQVLRLPFYKQFWFFSECNHFKYQLWERLYVEIVNWSLNKKKIRKTRKQKWNKKNNCRIVMFLCYFFFFLCFLSLFMVTFKYNSTIFRYITCLFFFCSWLFRFKEYNNG